MRKGKITVTSDDRQTAYDCGRTQIYAKRSIYRNENRNTPDDLFFKWGIKFEEEYKLPDKAARAVSYKERDELIKDVEVKYPQKKKEIPIEYEELTAKKRTTVKT